MAKPPDMIAAMHARHQLDRSSFDAARAYQSAPASALRQIETRLTQRVGGEGRQLVRDILGRGATIETVARERGDGDRPGIAWWGIMFRRCLRHLAEITGQPS